MSASSQDVDDHFDPDQNIEVTFAATVVGPASPVPSGSGDGPPQPAAGPVPSGSGDGPPQPAAGARRKRGLAPGTKRGPYKRVGADARERILEVYRSGGDWKLAATANGVAVRTAYGYITRPDGFTPAPRGGATSKKVDGPMVDKMVKYVEENPLITLTEIGRKLEADTGVSLSLPTIHSHLNGRMYTIKKVNVEPISMNSLDNKQKRALFVQQVMQANGQGRTIIYIDETNVNLFLRRSQGRSLRGVRCSVKAANARGPNIHVIGAMSQTGMVHWERRRGSFRKDDCKEWLRRALEACPTPLDRVTVVCDNAPVHTDLESVVADFPGLALLRTAPYSAPLNPIEAVWSSMKAHMKRSISSSLQEMLNTPHGMTQQEHRLRYLEARIDAAMEQITPVMRLHFYNHVQRHYAGYMTLADLAMGC